MAELFFEINDQDLIINNSCVACGKNATKLISECYLLEEGTNFFSTSICNLCHHVYRNVSPSEDWFIKNFKKRAEYQKESGLIPLNPEIEKNRYQRYHAIGSLIKNRYPELQNVLDIGCGPGTGLDAFKDQGFSIEGIEPDTSRSIIAKEKGYNIFEEVWENFISNQKFDLITTIHSLEHFQNPENFLKKLRIFAHKDTVMYIEVPEIIDHVKDWNDSTYLAHFSNFNQDSLVLLAERCGWKLISRIYPFKENIDLHQNHISMIFQLAGQEKHSAPFRIFQKELETSILNLYNKNLPTTDTKVPLKFYLKGINDLSLGYKSISEVKKNVHENFIGRKLTIVNDNSFIIS